MPLTPRGVVMMTSVVIGLFLLSLLFTSDRRETERCARACDKRQGCAWVGQNVYWCNNRTPVPR